ncbi:polar amino acid transport system substrate-binding protein [Cerasibacillus quisquiliarum]|uniref:ABC transporter substrate-binding protein n=1 Tax=Cerasibacillus quisquiliarum TaxID=227865 RepID=A0A511V1Y6_9BACI|nr:transporter substrate-binding domain-containing protein [Cerasibacillus quisquiliarum]MBB5146914.1 polar amino acid transport system substrate-binding protein [Cerasibacillus quisquiliarum]GEN31763.1 ABC transporter substrate-binding protein [Cerasibacillus quisquiliarum]
MKKNIVISLIVMLLVSLLAACSGEEETSSAKNGKDDKKILKMVTAAEFPPFETRNEAGEIIGFDIDLAEMISEKLGFELQIEDMNFDGIIGALQAGRADIAIAGMSATEERKKNVDFSEEYHHSSQMFISKPENEVKQMEDLKGKVVGVQLGSIQEEGAEKLADEYGFEVKKLDNVNIVIQEIMSNRVDVGYMDHEVATGYMESQDLVGFEDPTESAPGMGIAFPKDSELVEDVNKILNELEENGEMEKLREKWLSDYEAK